MNYNTGWDESGWTKGVAYRSQGVGMGFSKKTAVSATRYQDVAEANLVFVQVRRCMSHSHRDVASSAIVCR